MTVEIHFILHVVNGILITIIRILVQILFSENIEYHFSRAFVGQFFLLLDVILNSDWLSIVMY